MLAPHALADLLPHAPRHHLLGKAGACARRGPCLRSHSRDRLVWHWRVSHAWKPFALFWDATCLDSASFACHAIALSPLGYRRWLLLVGLPTIAYTQTYLDIDWAAVDAERDDGVSYSWAKLAQEGAPAAFGTFCVSPARGHGPGSTSLSGGVGGWAMAWLQRRQQARGFPTALRAPRLPPRCASRFRPQLVWVLTFNAVHPGTDYGAMAAAAAA